MKKLSGLWMLLLISIFLISFSVSAVEFKSTNSLEIETSILEEVGDLSIDIIVEKLTVSPVYFKSWDSILDYENGNIYINGTFLYSILENTVVYSTNTNNNKFLNISLTNMESVNTGFEVDGEQNSLLGDTLLFAGIG